MLRLAATDLKYCEQLCFVEDLHASPDLVLFDHIVDNDHTSKSVCVDKYLSGRAVRVYVGCIPLYQFVAVTSVRSDFYTRLSRKQTKLKLLQITIMVVFRTFLSIKRCIDVTIMFILQTIKAGPPTH